MSYTSFPQDLEDNEDPLGNVVEDAVVAVETPDHGAYGAMIVAVGIIMMTSIVWILDAVGDDSSDTIHPVLRVLGVTAHTYTWGGRYYLYGFTIGLALLLILIVWVSVRHARTHSGGDGTNVLALHNLPRVVAILTLAFSEFVLAVLMAINCRLDDVIQLGAIILSFITLGIFLRATTTRVKTTLVAAVLVRATVFACYIYTLHSRDAPPATNIAAFYIYFTGTFLIDALGVVAKWVNTTPASGRRHNNLLAGTLSLFMYGSHDGPDADDREVSAVGDGVLAGRLRRWTHHADRHARRRRVHVPPHLFLQRRRGRPQRRRQLPRGRAPAHVVLGGAPERPRARLPRRV